MKETWTLVIRTSLPYTCRDESELRVITKEYNSFTDAKTGFAEILKWYASSDNALFDFYGHIKYLDLYLEDIEEDNYNGSNDDEIMPGWATKKFYSLLQHELSALFLGESKGFNCPVGEYEDGYIYTTITPDSIELVGFDDGPINGIDPIIKTNILDMTEENHYYLYINDFFGGLIGQECSAELYMDLIGSLDIDN